MHYLEIHLNGICVHRKQRKVAVVVYADDVALFVTTPEEIPAIREAIKCYKKATAAVLNTGKTQATAVGMWDKTRRVLVIPYSAEIKVLGIRMTTSIAQSGLYIWTRITNIVRTQAKEAYSRDLDLAQRIHYVHTYLVAKLWHTTQVLRPPRDCIR